MTDKNFEDKLRAVCTEEIYIPQKFTHTIKNGLYENNKKWRFMEMKKAIVSILCIVFMGTGIVLAGNWLWNPWDNKGIKTALEYGYVQNIEMDYNVQNGLGIKFDSIIIDNSSIGLVLNYKIPSNLKNIDNIVLNDMVIRDENDNIIFEDGNENSLDTGYSVECASENGIVKQAILLNNLNHTFPKSNNLYISFSTVNLFRNQKKVKTITGNWNFNINVADKFVNRENIKYTASKSSDVEVTRAELTPTGLDIEIKFAFPVNAEELVNNMKIQDRDKNEYFSHGLNAEDETTTPTIKASFPITLYNAHDNLKLIIKIDDEVIIDLNKVK